MVLRVVLVWIFLGLACAHMQMSSPAPRLSVYSPFYLAAQNVDYRYGDGTADAPTLPPPAAPTKIIHHAT